MLTIAGLKLSAGTVAQAQLTTTYAKIICFSANTGGGVAAYGTNLDGDPAIYPDATNNWLRLNCPGIYKTTLNFSITASEANDVIFTLRKNVAGVLTTQPELSCELTTGTSGRLNGSIMGILKCLGSDAPGTIAMWTDPASTGFSGAGGWPKTQTTLDIVAKTLSGTATLTVEYANFLAEKIE